MERRHLSLQKANRLRLVPLLGRPCRPRLTRNRMAAVEPTEPALNASQPEAGKLRPITLDRSAVDELAATVTLHRAVLLTMSPRPAPAQGR